MTQADLAERAGMNLFTINRLINGHRSAEIANLKKLARATGISIERLVGDPGLSSEQ